MVEIINERFDWDNIKNVDYFLNPVNCVGVSGKGFALEVKNRFPEEESFYAEQCKLKKLKLGFFLQKNSVVFIPTKNHWTDAKTKVTKFSYKDILNGVSGVNVTSGTEHVLFYLIYCSLHNLKYLFRIF